MSKLAQWTRRRFVKTSAGTITAAATLNAFPGYSEPIKNSAQANLNERIKGTVIIKGEKTYETWRRAMIWQYAKADRRPDMIVQVESINDVQRAVEYAAENGMKATTRCGGHSMAACFMRNTGMLIDISKIGKIKVDVSTKTAEVGPGVFCRALAERLGEDGLAFPGAHCGMVPISGFLLGGGVGMNTNAWSKGISVFAVNGVDIVTADGQLLHASETENSDLFWAARGGGPGLFGVVVKFYLQCFDAPAVIWGATYVFPFKELDAVTALMNEDVPELDADVEVLYSTAANPDIPASASPEERQLIFLDINAFAASEEEGRRKLAPLTNHPLMEKAVEKLLDRAGSFDQYYTDNEAGFPQSYWMGDNVWLDDPQAGVDILKKHIADCPVPRAATIMLYTGEHNQPNAASSTFGRFYFAYYMEWDEPSEEKASREYCRKVFKEMKNVSNGSYINEMDQEGRPEDLHECYSPEAWAQFSELRTKWDPNSVFHNFYGQG